MAPSLGSRLFSKANAWRFCKSSAAASFTTIGAWQLWSRHSYFEPFGPEVDPLFRGRYFKQFNPFTNPTVSDSCVRKVPLTNIDPRLVEDSRNGGSELVERFCCGIWGGYGYAIQRNILNWAWKDQSNADGMLWDKDQLLTSRYSPGTIVTDHFIVLEKTPRSIIMRGGMSPAKDPESPREMDNLAEICVDIDDDQGQAEFRFKNIFFNGVAPGGTPGFPEPLVWLHLQYCKLLLEAGVSNCVQ
ncbi:hypothetical protein BBP40_004080 [Aspergillus hancockii]|nr:hypothetical protein BBP40_004080 [Aspergillus hancockii]